jgi:hypothetical protein
MTTPTPPPCSHCRQRPADVYDAQQRPVCAKCWLKKGK